MKLKQASELGNLQLIVEQNDRIQETLDAILAAQTETNRWLGHLAGLVKTGSPL